MAGTTRLLVTHQRQFLPLCDRVMVLRAGRVVGLGPWADVKALDLPELAGAGEPGAGGAECSVDELAEGVAPAGTGGAAGAAAAEAAAEAGPGEAEEEDQGGPGGVSSSLSGVPSSAAAAAVTAASKDGGAGGAEAEGGATAVAVAAPSIALTLSPSKDPSPQKGPRVGGWGAWFGRGGDDSGGDSKGAGATRDKLGGVGTSGPGRTRSSFFKGIGPSKSFATGLRLQRMDTSNAGFSSTAGAGSEVSTPRGGDAEKGGDGASSASGFGSPPQLWRGLSRRLGLSASRSFFLGRTPSGIPSMGVEDKGKQKGGWVAVGHSPGAAGSMRGAAALSSASVCTHSAVATISGLTRSLCLHALSPSSRFLDPRPSSAGPAGQLVQAEERVHGSVPLAVYARYLGQHIGTGVTAAIAAAMIAGQAAFLASEWWVGPCARLPT